MATLVRYPVPQQRFCLQGTGLDINRVLEACRTALRNMEEHEMLPTDVIMVDIPEADQI